MEPLQQDGADVLLRVKAVPGASRDALRGRLGERLKIAVTAPPEGGQANAAIIRLVAATLGVSARSIIIETGHSSPLKTLRIRDRQLEDVAAALPV